MTDKAKPKIPNRDDLERQLRIERAQFLVDLYVDHRDALNTAFDAIRKAATTSSVINQVGHGDYGDEARKSYFYVLVGALIVQGIPLAEAYILADDSTTSHFTKLRSMPEAGNA